jgi:calcium permeable stress-gated cation channel
MLTKFVNRRFLSNTPRKEFEAMQSPQLKFSLFYSTLCMTFLLCMTFSVISPLILPFGCMIYGFAFLVMKYQLMVRFFFYFLHSSN